jgi:hypothetical protein
MADWLAWLCSPQDRPLVLVLALVLAVWALAWRAAIPGKK